MENISDLSKDIFSFLEKSINENRLNDAKLVIEEYEQKIEKYNEDIYSFKAMIYLMEDDLSSAEDILIKGLILYPRSFDLLYNLGYINECKKDCLNALNFYNYASLYCVNNSLEELNTKIDNIRKNNVSELKEDFLAMRMKKVFLYKLIGKLMNELENSMIQEVDCEEFTNSVCISNIRDKKCIVDRIDEFIKVYIELKSEKIKDKFLSIITSKIIYNTERYFLEKAQDNKDIVKIVNNGHTDYIGLERNVTEESNSFIEQIGQIDKNDMIIVYGLALGHHIVPLLDKIQGTQKIIIIEPRIEVFNLFKLCENYNKLISSSNVSICFIKDKDLENILVDLYKSNYNVKFKCYSNYNKIFKNDHAQFCDKLKTCFNANYKLEPEGFAYKMKQFIKKEQIEVLVTGISYAMYAFYPPYMERTTFNFALNSQDIFYDFEVVKYLINFEQINKHLKYVIISLAYYSFDYDLSKSKNEARLLHRYIEEIKTLHHYKNKKGMEILHEVYKQTYSIEDFNNIYINNFHKNISEGDMLNQRELAIKHSSNNFPETVIENEILLEEYIVMLKKIKVKPIVVVCPTSKSYNKYYSSDSKNRFYSSINKIRSKHEFQFLDYFYSEKFDESDYYDGSHMNIKGAKKFAKILQEDIVW